MIIGSIETCDLPDLGIFDLQIRVDTGAKTSSLHVDNIRRFKENGRPHVRFDIHPDIYNVESVIEATAPLKDIRQIKSSNGESQERYVIKTTLVLGDQSWPIELTLTNRSDMTYLMLFGRQGMGDKVLVDPSETFLVTSSPK
ncbi:ATP-dependent zinc protease family protein [Saccharophagus degradans]|nr:ATP-dependent zinc protease [Saccharophagus degradans]MDO6421165.1 ATP-dependent zinc protease [Saccharophagus degradans]MDO6605924.1 ATP-dependent zinc protease [Saccharophagus degradans]WGO96472.1 ATP-dependent zinc protease [Saccharophagus degradans]